jgi:hypothetical protein
MEEIAVRCVQSISSFLRLSEDVPLDAPGTTMLKKHTVSPGEAIPAKKLLPLLYAMREQGSISQLQTKPIDSIGQKITRSPKLVAAVNDSVLLQEP